MRKVIPLSLLALLAACSEPVPTPGPVSMEPGADSTFADARMVGRCVRMASGSTGKVVGVQSGYVHGEPGGAYKVEIDGLSGTVLQLPRAAVFTDCPAS